MKIVTRCHENYDEMGLFVQSTVIEIMTSLFYHTDTAGGYDDAVR